MAKGPCSWEQKPELSVAKIPGAEHTSSDVAQGARTARGPEPQQLLAVEH